MVINNSTKLVWPRPFREGNLIRLLSIGCSGVACKGVVENNAVKAWNARTSTRAQ